MKSQLFFILTILLLTSNETFGFELKKKDSTKVFVGPKRELFINYFNPINFIDIERFGAYHMDYSWNRKNNKYFVVGGRHYHNRSLPSLFGDTQRIIYDHIYFTHMHRIHTKRDWLSFEFDYGIAIGRRFGYSYNSANTYRYSDETYAIGPIGSFEIQFGVGDWGNISLKSELSCLFGQEVSKTTPINDYKTILSSETAFNIVPWIWPLNVGVNFYF